MKTRIRFRYFVTDYLWKLFLDSNSTQTPPNLVSLTILETLRPFTLFKPKTRAIKLQSVAKICLTL